MSDQWLYFDSEDDLSAYTQSQDVGSSKDLYFDTIDDLNAYISQDTGSNGNAIAADQEPQTSAKTDTLLQATGKALSNVPERFQQSVGGMVQMLGEDMGIERERYISDRARRAGVSPDDYKLIAAAAQQGVFDEAPQASAQEALDYLNQTGFTGQTSSVVEPEQVAEYGQQLGEQAQTTMKPINVDDGSAAYYVSSAIGSLAEMAPALAASFATRRVEPALAVMAGQVGGQSYARAREQGATVEDAQRYATGSVAAEVIPSALPIGVVLQRGKSLVSKVLGTAAAEGAQEVITESINIGLDNGILDEGVTWGEALTRLKDAGIIGTLAGGGTGAVGSGVDVATEAYQRANPERQFAREMQANIDAPINDQLAGEMRRLFGDPLTPTRPPTEIEMTPPGLVPIVERIEQQVAELRAKAQPQPVESSTAIDASFAPESFGTAYGDQSPGQVPNIATPLASNLAVENNDSSLSVSDKLELQGLAVVEVPVDALALSDDVPQFKSGANELGVVDELGGTFDRTGVAPIQVWVRLDGRQEVISGRHRLDLARRSGETTIPSQLHYESQGFDVNQAATLDALLNIREGQGQVRDYVSFIKGSELSEQEADAQGILARQTGRRAYSIATQGTDALIAAHAAGDITDDAAARIAGAAPADERLQAVGLSAVLSGKSGVIAENMVKAVKAMNVQPSDTGGDLFGFDDSAIKEAERMAREASTVQRTIQKSITAIKGAAKNPKLAAREGVRIDDPDSVKDRLNELQAQKERWNKWPTDRELVAQLTQGMTPDQNTESAYESNDTDEGVPETLFNREDTFNAKGNNYVPTYSQNSEGMPDRKETYNLDGQRQITPRVQRWEPIRHLLTKIIGRRIYYRHVKGKGVGGFYRPASGELRTRKKNDIEILAHEMAHYLDFYSLRNDLPDFQALYKSPTYRPEVMELSYTDSDPTTQNLEGFAEFVRLWLTNAPEAKAKAPQFNKAFTKALKENKKLYKQMKRLRQLMHNWYYQGHMGRMEAGVGHEPELAQRFDEWWYRRVSRVRQEIIDRGEAYKQAEIELTKHIGPAEASAWKLHRMAVGGYRDVAKHVIEYGTINWNADASGFDVTGKSLREVLAPLNEVTLKEQHKRLAKDKVSLLMSYFKAKRSVELYKQGRENQVNIDDAKKTVALEETYPEFKAIFDDYQQFNKRLMDFYERSGLLSKKSRKAIEKMNKNYVPFQRIREYIGGAKAPKGGFKRLTGGTANTEDILINIQDGIVENVKAAMMNRSKQVLYGTITGSQDGALFATLIPPRSEKISVEENAMRSKIEQAMIEAGVLEPGVDPEFELDAEMLQFWKHGLPPGVGDSGNIIDSVMLQGKVKYFEVSDPLLTEAIQALDPIVQSKIIKFAIGVRNTLTRSVTLGFQFMGANFVMDNFSGLTFTKNKGFIPIIHPMMGMYDYFRKNETYQAFIRAGGGGSSLEAITRQGVSRRTVGLSELGTFTIPERILVEIDRFAAATEYGTRIAEYKLSRKSGKSEFESAFDAQEISTNYNVVGGNAHLVQFMRTIHFFNASLQSMDRMYREFKTKRLGGNVLNFMVRGVLGLMLPTALLYMFNREDEAYLEEPQHKRYKNWYIPIGRYENGRTKYFLIPRPYDAGHLFGSMPEIAIEAMIGEQGDRPIKDLMWVLGNMFSLDPTPSVALGVTDLALNKDWKGAPVVPPHLQGVELREQFDTKTSETFYRLGQATGMSPMQAEHMFSTSFGYLGGYALYVSDLLLWDKDQFGDKPARQQYDNPFITRFFTPSVRSHIRETGEFFDLVRDAEVVYRTFGLSKDSQRSVTGRMGVGGFSDDPIKGLTKEEKQTLYGLHSSLSGLTSSLFGRDGMKAQELAIIYNDKLSDTEKRQQIDAMWQARNEALKSAMVGIRFQMAKAMKLSEKRKRGDK